MAKVRKIEFLNVGSCDLSPAISSRIAAAMPPKKFLPPVSQGSNGSQGSSSPGQGFSNGSRVRRTMVERKNHKTPSPSTVPRSKRAKGSANAAVGGGLGQPLGKNDGGDGRMATEMPLVSTRGDGRNGRRIQGFLYKCGSGEVRIVCVCHGSFLTPAEFVKHGGGGDVAHPLRHIIVNPSSPPFL